MRPPWLHTPAHRVTTRHLQAVYPFQAGAGLGARGVLIGTDHYSGSAFYWDPFELVNRGVVSGPNTVLIGKVGRGKSSLLKTFMLRAAVFGRRSYVLDPKGEYAAFAEAMGLPSIRLHPGGTVRLNPLDPGPGAAALGRDEIRSRQLRLVRALLEAGLNRALLPREVAAVAIALDLEAAATTQPTLPGLARALADPDARGAEAALTTVDQLRADGHEAALVLLRLVTGDLAGMFDAPTNVRLDWDQGLVLDLSAVLTGEAFALVLICAGQWLTSALARTDVAHKKLLVVDEAWKVLEDRAAAGWLRSNLKLCRQWGLANILALHRLADLSTAGEAGTAQRAMAEGLLSDCETRIVYGLDAKVAADTATLLGLGRRQQEAVAALGRGEGLWSVGSHRFRVRHHRVPAEVSLTETNQAMR